MNKPWISREAIQTKIAADNAPPLAPRLKGFLPKHQRQGVLNAMRAGDDTDYGFFHVKALIQKRDDIKAKLVASGRLRRMPVRDAAALLIACD